MKMEKTAGIANSSCDVFAADVETQNTPITAASDANPRTAIITCIPRNKLGGDGMIEHEAFLEVEQWQLLVFNTLAVSCWDDDTTDPESSDQGKEEM